MGDKTEMRSTENDCLSQDNSVFQLKNNVSKTSTIELKLCKHSINKVTFMADVDLHIFHF